MLPATVQRANFGIVSLLLTDQAAAAGSQQSTSAKIRADGLQVTKKEIVQNVLLYSSHD
jgi:hypothetical protein